jgi:hypothetical protein
MDRLPMHQQFEEWRSVPRSRKLDLSRRGHAIIAVSEQVAGLLPYRPSFWRLFGRTHASAPLYKPLL